MCDGKLLDDNRALVDYDIQSGSTLRLDKMIQIVVDPEAYFHGEKRGDDDSSGQHDHGERFASPPTTTVIPLKVISREE